MHVTKKNSSKQNSVYFPSAQPSDPEGHRWSLHPTLVKVKYLFLATITGYYYNNLSSSSSFLEELIT
jgi:hypothetical protein